MNLLPQDKKRKIEQERIYRFLIVDGLGIMSILIIALILLLPTYLLLVMQSMELERQLDLEKQSSELYRAENIETSMKDINVKIKLFNDNEKILTNPSNAIKSIIDYKLPGISINSFTYRGAAKSKNLSSLSIAGEAETRDELLDFVKLLERDDNFDSVESPVSNLLTKTRVEYSLIINLKSL